MDVVDPRNWLINIIERAKIKNSRSQCRLIRTITENFLDDIKAYTAFTREGSFVGQQNAVKEKYVYPYNYYILGEMPHSRIREGARGKKYRVYLNKKGGFYRRYQKGAYGNIQTLLLLNI